MRGSVVEVDLLKSGGGGVNFALLPIGIARTMILAIVTSRETEPGKSKWRLIM